MPSLFGPWCKMLARFFDECKRRPDRAREQISSSTKTMDAWASAAACVVRGETVVGDVEGETIGAIVSEVEGAKTQWG